MKLGTYLTRMDKTRAQFAAEIGVDLVTVGRYVTGARRPRWEIMARIAEATKGQVTADDFLDAAKPRRPSGPGRAAAA
tara:strand:- start:1551 stop:1784 length:234 start_codon:yes stop_codon:yes gene_type:complete